MTKTLDYAALNAKKWIEELNGKPINARAEYNDLKTRFDERLPITSTPSKEVISDLISKMDDGLLGSAGGRFFAWVIGGGLESALAADWLVSAWDQNAALYACGPGVSVVEEIAGQWILELLHLPKESSFAFTTGCQLAHMTCLATARHSVLKAEGWDVEQNGLNSAPPVKVIVNDQKHGSIQQAISFLGLGQNCFISIETNGTGKIAADDLIKVMNSNPGPKIVVLNAADLNIGACDDFTALIPIAKAEGAWVHIDGAFGLFARASSKYAHLVEGLELADSWATDGHKWLNVPYDCGIAIVKDKEAHRAAMTISASYIAPEKQARDQIDWNPEWSRRARGVPVYAALKELGRQGVENLVERCCEYCKALTEGIGALDNVEVVAYPTLNQALVRFTKDKATYEENDIFTLDVMSKINSSGEAFFSDTIWQGRQAMRISVVNWRTSSNDVERTIQAVAQVLEGMKT